MNPPPSSWFRSLGPAFALALGLPVVIRAALPADEVGDFAMAGLGLGCAILAARGFGDRFRRTTSAGQNPEDSMAGRPRTTPGWMVAALSLAAAMVFILFNPAPPGHAGLPIPLLALFTLAPALGIVPYLTLQTGRPFAAVVLATFIVASIKLAACVVVRIVYGPDAQTDGYMSADWQSARLMISLFWVGTVSISLALGMAAGRLEANRTTCVSLP